MTKLQSSLLVLSLVGISSGKDSEFRYLTEPEDVRPVLQKYSRNPFRYQGIWSLDSKDPFESLTTDVTTNSEPSSSKSNGKMGGIGGIRPPNEEFLSKVETLMPKDAPRAAGVPISSEEGPVRRMELGPEETAVDEPHFMRPYLLVTAPFLSESRGSREIFPGECKLRYANNNVSEVLQPFEEIELETGSNRDVKESDQFKIYEVGDHFQAYSSGAPLGRLIRVVGMAEIKRVGRFHSVARMTRCFGTISRQSRAAPIGELPKVSASHYAPSDGALHVGRILWMTPPHQIPQPFSQIIIDGGMEGGFKVGDFVSIFSRRNGRMTDKVLGSAVVLRSESKSSTLMLQDVEPGVIYPGDFAVVHLSATP